MIEAPIVSADWDHDVAILRATPNPFTGEKKIAYLPLSAEVPALGSAVLSASLRPADLENARSFLAPLEDFSRGEVIRYQLYRENQQQSGERELVLFNQPVLSGQSGSPLLSADSHAVVGIVVGRWLHPVVIPSGNQSGHETMAPGAALRIHYAIGLLEQLHVGWHKPAAPIATPEHAAAEKTAEQAKGFTPPVPLSVVSTRYPPRALYGGEVLLDALVDSSGKLTDVRVIAGDQPFLDTVLGAVRTWTFTPARKEGRVVEARVGIVFQFPQSFLPHIVSREHKHPETLEASGDRAALPALSVEPEYPPRTTSEGTVTFYGVVDSQGQLASTSVLRDIPTLTEPVVSSAHEWLFAPAERDGSRTDSTLVVVVAFRRPTP
jgi:TonB family protein